MSAPVLTSNVNVEGDDFKIRVAHNRSLKDELWAKVAQSALGGNEKSRERHTSRGKLLPRDRVERLLDPGSPFLEIGQPLAGKLLHHMLTIARMDEFENLGVPGWGPITPLQPPDLVPHVGEYVDARNQVGIPDPDLGRPHRFVPALGKVGQPLSSRRQIVNFAQLSDDARPIG